MKTEDFTKAVRSIVLARKNFNKIFCIGNNKTGTTTMKEVLKTYGYSLPNQQEQEVRLTKSVFSTDYTEFQRFVSGFDAFQDMPFSQGLTYVAADTLFPNSRFILTERRPEEWYSSLVNFHKKVFKLSDLKNLTEHDVYQKFVYLYPGYSHENIAIFLMTFTGGKAEIRWDLLYDKDYYIAMYETRNTEIKRYFANAAGKLLVIDVTKERDTSRLCEFLNIPEDMVIEMPHANKT